MIKLMHGDCLEVLKTLESGSIDLILTDPPYGTTQCKWDTIIPFDAMWVELKRVIKPNGAIVLFGSEPFSSALRMSNIEGYKYDWVWEKNTCTGFANAKRRPLKIFENIIVFNTKTYHPQGLVEINKTRVNSVSTGGESTGVLNKNKTYIQTHTNYPKNILKFASESKTVHPTQKPVPLLEYMIKTYTKEGETVLDFTCGSGSTGVACVNTNRNFIGIELDEKYFEISQKRIAEAVDKKGILE